MPVWTRTEFDTFYSALGERWGHPNTHPAVWLHYHWWPITRWQASDYAPRLAQVLGLVSGDVVLLVGAGFNGTGAGLEALGITVVGLDVSNYILDNFGQTEEAEIREACLAAGVDPDTDTIWGPPGNVRVNPLDVFLEGGRAAPAVRGKGRVLGESMSSRPSRNSVKNALASSPRFIISEEVLNSITDAEALQACDAGARFASENGGGTIVHMLSPVQEGTVQAAGLNWKTYAGWRTFLDANGFAAQRILPTVTASGQGVTLPPTNEPGVVTAYSGLI